MWERFDVQQALDACPGRGGVCGSCAGSGELCPGVELLCSSGTPISGGYEVNAAVTGVDELANHVSPGTGTPTTWRISLSNASGQDLTVTSFVTCVAGRQQFRQDPQARRAIIVKKTVTKIVRPRKAGH